jgi:ABC-type glutathione transport system ATPase component
MTLHAPRRLTFGSAFARERSRRRDGESDRSRRLHRRPPGADILLADEVLAVGGAHFQQKCLERMEEVRRRGTTLLLVSHALDTIVRMCDRACVFVRGRLEADGDPGKVVARYRELVP